MLLFSVSAITELYTLSLHDALPCWPIIAWKLMWNDSGVILEILEIDAGSFFDVTVHLLNRFLDFKCIFLDLQAGGISFSREDCMSCPLLASLAGMLPSFFK